MRSIRLAVLGAALLSIVWGCQAGGWRNESHDLRRLEKSLRHHGLVTIKRPDVWTENRLHTYRREFEEAFIPRDNPPFSSFTPKINATESAVQLERLGVMLDAALKMEAAAESSRPKLSHFLASSLVSGVDLTDPDAKPNFGALVQSGLKAYLAKSTGIDPAIFATATADDNGGGSGGKRSGGRAKSTDGEGGGNGADDAPDNGSEGGEADDSGGDDSEGGEPGGGESESETEGGATAGEAGKGEGGDDKDGGAEEGASAPAFKWLLDAANDAKLLEVPQAPDASLLSPFQEEEQKRAFVQQNQLFRIGNEPDDGTRMNGYSLYYMRFMVSVAPGAETRKNHSAEILLSPQYDVLDATRDWLAQYVRGMLRERITRTLEVGLQRSIGEILYAHAEHKCTADEMQVLQALQLDIEDTIELPVKRANKLLEGAPSSGKWIQAEEALRAVASNVSELRASVPATTGRTACFKQKVEKLSDLLDLLGADVQLVLVSIADRQEKKRAASLAANVVAAQLVERMQEKEDDFNRALQDVVKLEPGTPDYYQKAIGKLKVAQSIGQSDDDVDPSSVDAVAAQVTALETMQTAERKVTTGFSELISSIRAVATQLSVGAQFDQLQKEIANDVGVRLRRQYLAMLNLAQLAYEDYAKELDYRIGVPNAVSANQNLVGDHSSIRVTRARNALKKILEWNPTQAENGNSVESDDSLQAWVKPIKSKTLNHFITFGLAQLKELVNGYRDVADSARALSIGLDPSGPSLCPCGHNEICRKCRINLLKDIIIAASPYKKLIDEWKSDKRRHSVSKVKLRRFFSPKNWPVYTFAVAPFSEAENIGRAINLNNELQVLLKGAFSQGKAINVEGALEYARAIREQFRAVQVDRTVVGLVRGEQHFGWQINPPYRIPVSRSSLSGRFKHDDAAEMPSRTYEVFALVAVPGFLRNLDLTVSYDWTARRRSDRTEIGTARAMRYLRQYRHIKNRVGDWREGRGGQWWLDGPLSARNYWDGGDGISDLTWDGNPEDNLFLGELLDEKLEQVEASLPLRKMRQVFLPYADVSERMTNTMGISDLKPSILRVTPRYLPSHETVVMTIEGKNFDTGRLEVIVGGVKAADVQLTNDHTIVATVPARKVVGDLTIQLRTQGNREYANAQKTVNGRKLLHSLEGLLEVVVITPTGMTTELALVRLTKGDPIPEPKNPAPKKDPPKDWNGRVLIHRDKNGEIDRVEVKDGDIESALKILDRIKEALVPKNDCKLEVVGEGCVEVRKGTGKRGD